MTHGLQVATVKKSGGQAKENHILGYSAQLENNISDIIK